MDRFLTPGVSPSSCIVAASAHMNSVLRRVVRTAESASPMFVVGELGVGKERIIRLAHSISPLRSQPFVKVNCEAIQQGVLHEVLFGKSDTKLVASSNSQQGLLERAAGGTLLLHNVDCLPLWSQKAILNAAQSGAFYRKGRKTLVPFGARIAATMRCNPAKSRRNGQLLSALEAYLDAATIKLEPLRNRPDDIRLLAYSLIEEMNDELLPCDRKLDVSFTEEALKLMEAYYWPGNVYELANFVRRVFVFAGNSPVTAAEAIELLPQLRPRKSSGTVAADIARRRTPEQTAAEKSARSAPCRSKVDRYSRRPERTVTKARRCLACG